MSKIPSLVFVFVCLLLCTCALVYLYCRKQRWARLSTIPSLLVNRESLKLLESLLSSRSDVFQNWVWVLKELNLYQMPQQVQLIPDRCLLLPFVSLSASKIFGKHLPRSKLRSKLTSGGDATVLRTGPRQQAQAFFSPGHSLTLSCFNLTRCNMNWIRTFYIFFSRFPLLLICQA